MNIPARKPVQALKTTFQVGSRSKKLGVFGNRYWNQITRTMSDPEPFTEMELKYENSFGGTGYKNNPTGKGYGKIKNDMGKTIWPLPNIEHLDNLIDSPGKAVEPAGFGPLGNMWHQRYSKLGTYKGSWLKERWPWYPKDFDWGYFNAGPPDMQVEGYLKGDEALYFEHLHGTRAMYRSQLPGITIRLFLNVIDAANSGEIQFHEVPLRLDTLWVNMESEKLVLVWRGVAEVQSEDYEEIQHVFIVSEKLKDTAKTTQFHHDRFLSQMAEEEEMEEAETKEEVHAIEEETIDVEAEIAKIEAEVNAELIDAGIDPDQELPEPSPGDKEAEARLIKELGLEEDVPEPPLTRERLLERVSNGESLSGMDLRGMDLSETDLHEVDFTDALLSEVKFQNTDLTGANLISVDLSNADLTGAILKGAVFKDADLTGALLCDTDMTGTMLEDAIFDGADLRQAKLDSSVIKDGSFLGSNLTNASLQQCECYAADFSQSILNKADFQGADLTEASVENAQGVGVNMIGANLTGIRASGATNFSQGLFQNVTAPYAIWENAILNDTDFSHSNMEGVNFASASLKGAKFIGADLKFSRLSKANLFQAICVGMNLFEANLVKADLTETDFRGTNLYGAEFLDAKIEKTRFEQANLKMTKLSK